MRRQIIDNCIICHVPVRVLMSLIFLLASALASVGSEKETWTDISPEEIRLNADLERQLLDGNGDLAASERLCRRLAQIAATSPEENSRLLSAYWDSECAFRSDTVSGAGIIGMLSSVMPVDSIKYPYGWFRINFARMRALLYNEKNYTEAYRMAVTMLPYLRKIGFRLCEALVTSSLGLIHHRIGNYSDALRNMRQARKLYAGQGHPYDSLNNELNICNTLASMGHTDVAKKMLLAMKSHPVALRISRLECNILMSLNYFTQDERYAYEAHRQAIRSGSRNLYMKTLQNISNVLYLKGEVDSALVNMKKVYAYFRRLNDTDYMVPLRAIVEIYRMRSDRDSTLKYMTELVEVQDSFNIAETSSLKNRMKLQQDISNYRINASLSEAKLAIAHRTTIIIVILLLFVISSGGMIWFFQRRKAQSQKKLHQLENERLALNLSREKMQNEHYQDKIEYQERALSSKVLLLHNKNAVLTDLMEQINMFASSGQLPKAQARILEKKIKENMGNDSEWNDFMMHFEQVNPNFFETLRSRYPRLSDKDVKLCAYFKLGLSIKQIAKMLSVLPESINTSRYRLRRKMGLDGDTAIEDILREI